VNKPVLYIHAGSHKTGTTAIQQAMRAARGELRRQGVCWPVLRSNPEHSKLAHSKLVRVAYAEGLRHRVHERWLVGRLRWQGRGCTKTIFSSEKIYRIGYEFFEHAEQDTPGKRERRVRCLRRLRTLFEDHFDIRVLLYLRRVDEFAESMYKELQFRKPYAGSFRFEDFLVQQRALFRYADQVQELQQYLGPVSLQSYDEARRRGLVEHFCGLVGVTLPARLQSGSRVRRSASNTASLFLNRLAEERPIALEDRLEVLEFSLSGRLPEPEGGVRSLWPSRASLESFLQQHREPALDHLFPAIEWGEMRFDGMSDREFEANRSAFEDWRRARTGGTRDPVDGADGSPNA